MGVTTVIRRRYNWLKDRLQDYYTTDKLSARICHRPVTTVTSRWHKPPLRTSPESLRTTNGRDVRTLNQLLLFPVVLTKFFRRASLLLFEDPVEVGKIIESALIADFGY